MRAILALTTAFLAFGLLTSPQPRAAEAQQTPAEPGRTRLVLNEQATRDVEQDTLVAIVTAHAEAATAREAQAAVNTAMTDAVGQAQAVQAVQRATGGYRVYQERDKKGQPHGWVAEQDLRLTSHDAGPLLELVGTLQGKGLLLGGLSYDLSPQARKAVEDELIAEVLAALRARAERVAEALTMRVDTIETLRLGGAGEVVPIRPMLRAQAMEAMAAPPPTALPDRETVRLTVEAEVLLAPR